uniref:Uncharacterized protein n=1 Tax=Plectus sambesii TaxID=2011161 RepID=A0A914VC76_9BILA
MSATMTSHCSSAVDVFIGDFWAFNRKPTLILADYGERLSSTSMWLSAMESMEKVTNNAELHLCCQQENVNVSTSAWATMAKASSELRKYAEATNQLTAVAPSPAPMGRQAAETPSLLPDSVDFGFNGTAAYWLQTIPVAIAQDNGGSIDPMDFPEGDQGRSALVEQAAADWENYLNERIREMAANSFHLALVLAVDGQASGEHMIIAKLSP